MPVSKELERQREAERAARIQRNKDLVSSYKTNIDLSTYLTDVGFNVDRKRSSNKWPVLIDPDTDRRLIVVKSRANNEYFYYNPEDDQDKGSIIDMMAEKMRLDLTGRDGWLELHKAASAMLGSAYYEESNRMSRCAAGHNDDTREGALSQYFKLDPLTSTHYLQHERKLSPDVIFAPEFESKIFNRPFIDTTFQNAGKNTVFPIENENGVIGIINRSSNWNQIEGRKDNGVWVSNIGPDTRQLVISEAPIDSMSYHQINPPQRPLDTVYLATAGTISYGQQQTMQYIINAANIKQVVLANDNDFAGIRNNINLAGKLTLPGQPDTGYDVKISNNKYSNTLTIDVDWPRTYAQGSVPASNQALVDKVNGVMNRGYPPGEEKAVISFITQTDTKSQIKVNFPNVRPLLIRAENLTGDLRQNEDRIVIRRSQENDFSQELMLRELKKEVQEQYGIKLTGAQAEALIGDRKSPILLDKDLTPGKLILEHTREGVTPMFVARQPALVIPDSFRGQAINNEDADALKRTGEMGRRIETVSPLSGEIQPGYIGVDRDLNTLVFVKSNLLKNFNVVMADLTREQTKAIVAGKTIDTVMKVSKEETPVRLRIEATLGEISLKKIDPATGRELGKAKTKTKRDQQKPPMPGTRQEGGTITVRATTASRTETTPKVTTSATTVKTAPAKNVSIQSPVTPEVAVATVTARPPVKSTPKHRY